MSNAYPFLVQPRSVAALWGGTALEERFGKRPQDGASIIAESWECWGENLVANGPLAGKRLDEVLGPVPLLTKLIDARDALSVQVHPGDAYAISVEHQPNGKTECWYVLEAEPGASVVLGWNQGTSREEYERRVADGTLGELLRSIRVEPGDVLYLPAGLVHSIGAGIVLFEAQQSSDLTYRIFDWNRKDANGNLRELHVAKAADVLDYGRAIRGTTEPLQFPEHGVIRTALVAGAAVALERLTIEPDATVPLEKAEVPRALMALGHAVEIGATGSNPLRLDSYQTAVLPALLEGVTVRGLGLTTALLIASPGSPGLRGRLERAGVDAPRIADFLAQF